MRIYYITGTSRGIGKALAEKVLEKEDAMVYGISRTHSIEHERYRPLEMDLSDLEALRRWDFGDHEEAGELVLINNAGTLGSIKPVGKDEDEAIQRAFDLNLSAPAILMNKFIKRYQELPAKKLIVNVSSGAGKHAIDGWSCYCASKAGLDMFSQVVEEEQQVHRYPSPVRVMAIAPGIVETRMQEEIRGTSEADFSSVGRFHESKAKGQLADPQEVAEKYLRIMDDPDSFPEVLLSVRDLENP